MWKPKLRGSLTRRPGCPRPSRRALLADLTGIELLDRRVLPAVTATFSAAGAALRVLGDAQDNTIVVSRDAAGSILVNNGAVAIQGDPGATVVNTRMIMIVGAGGNDNLSLDETNGVMPAASLFGGDGDDVLTGGSGDDFVDGGAGNDIVFLGAGDDTFQWNPGDGSDSVDGEGGGDTMVFNGSDATEKIDVSANGRRVRFTRDVGDVTINLNHVEAIDVNALGGADAITVNDTSATDLSAVNLNLAGSAGSGDGQADAVNVNGTNGDDTIRVLSNGSGTRITVAGLFPSVNITGAEGANDTLTVNALGGDDVVDASSLSPHLIGLTVNLGDGQAVAVTTTLRASTATAVFGQTVLLTATVNSLAGTPTGTVTFLDGGTVLGTAPSDTAGQATLMASLGVGNHSLRAVFGGNGGFDASTSAVVAETINQAATALVLSPSANPAVRGQTVTFTATVTSVAPGAGTPTGTVTFMDGEVVVGTAAVGGDGTATFTTTFVASGLHAVTAVYGGDRDFVGRSQTATEQVSAPVLAVARTSLVSSANPARRRHPVVFRATVRGQEGVSSPTGTITFMVGNLPVAQVRLDASGNARWTGRFSSRGRFIVRAIYSGDGEFAGSSNSLTERIV